MFKMKKHMMKPAVAQLAHAELFTPKMDETLWFFKDVLGMYQVAREGQSVYLKAYEDFYHHSLKLTKADQPGLGHVAWRTSSKEVLEETAKHLEKIGLGEGWTDGDLGHGPAYQFNTPDGHPSEILWEIDYYEADEKERSAMRSRSQKRPLRGVPVRRLDHINLLSKDVEKHQKFLQESLDFNLRELKLGEREKQIGAWLSVSNLVHEIGIMQDGRSNEDIGPRLHHLAFWYGYPQNLFDLADVCVDHDIEIEMGQGKHGATQSYFLYVFEPGGNRIELFGDTGYLIFDPDWETIVWDVSNKEDLEKSSIWFGPRLEDTFYNYGTPNE